MTDNKGFNFDISLSVLNHLGRNLYRNFITVLGEAISNSWDAEAENVWITIDKETSLFLIKDDGNGMTTEEFQNKFLKIGYSKRKNGACKTDSGRPFIGAKGIGKLALLSCADKISIFTKTSDTEYVGGVIDNDGLDKAITSDMTAEQYQLEDLDFSLIKCQTADHKHGTIIHFAGIKQHIHNSIPYLRKLIAMTFRFSVIDKNFTIHVDGTPVGVEDLNDLAEKTQFCWVVNSFSDEFTKKFGSLAARRINIQTQCKLSGFLATVKTPRYLKITGTDERATVDLFVNGRLREKNILQHIPTQRVPENYLYGQLHFDEMDGPDRGDPFTTSREGILDGDEKFQSLLKCLKNTIIPKILREWDELRLEQGEDGDEKNTPDVRKKERIIKSLCSLLLKEYSLKDETPAAKQVDKWMKELGPDAESNIAAYVDCFYSENLVRKYIKDQRINLSDDAKQEAQKWQKKEDEAKGKANISFDIRKDRCEEAYLGMDDMAKSIEPTGYDGRKASLTRDAVGYKPVRDALAHTGLLSDDAKKYLSTSLANIKGRIRTLLKG